MTLFTSIPAYLLKNTFQRWIENPASPITKVVITLLFSVLAFLIFGIFQLFETQIREQLNRNDLRTITTVESLWGENAQRRIYNGTDESHLWKKYSQSFHSYQQAPLLVDTFLFKKVPLLSYDTPPQIDGFPASQVGEPRPIVVFSKHSAKQGSDYIKIEDYKIPAIRLPFPDLLKARYNSPAVAMVPNEIIEPLLERGFAQIQVILPKKSIDPEELQNLLKAHAHAEGRRVNVRSSVAILSKLQEFLSNQQHARIIIGAVISAILSLTLGALSLLEFRQEQYLLALLRSFGVKRAYLYIHYLFETTALTFAGLWGASYVIKHFSTTLLHFVELPPQINFQIQNIAASIASKDFNTLLLAISAGVIISSIPVALGLRKQTGLFLP